MSSNATSPKRIGLVAGWGRFPLIVARTLKQNGYEVYCMGVHGHASPELADICDDFRYFGLAKTNRQIRFLRRHGCGQATMAGKIFKTMLFKKFGLLRHFPDPGFVRCFYPVMTRKLDRRDDTLLTLATNYWANQGINFAPATDFAPELLVTEGLLTRKSPSSAEMQDIRFGWKMAKEMGRLDIGQSIAVKDQAVLAVEAIEGTDECIKRAGALCKKGGFTVVKVAKPNQDMRFDVPTIGVGTIETIHASGGRILAIEADMTIVLDQEETISLANRLGISIIALNSAVQSEPVAA